MSTASTIKSLAAYDLIRDMILSGEALPGTRLVLVDLEKARRGARPHPGCPHASGQVRPGPEHPLLRGPSS